MKLEADSLFEQTSSRISSRRKVHRGFNFGLPIFRPLSGIKPSSSSESTSRLLRPVAEAIAPPQLALQAAAARCTAAPPTSARTSPAARAPGEFVRRGCTVYLYDHTEYTRNRAFQTLRASLWDHVANGYLLKQDVEELKHAMTWLRDLAADGAAGGHDHTLAEADAALRERSAAAERVAAAAATRRHAAARPPPRPAAGTRSRRLAASAQRRSRPRSLAPRRRSLCVKAVAPSVVPTSLQFVSRPEAVSHCEHLFGQPVL